MYHCKACGSHDVIQNSRVEHVRYREDTLHVRLSFCVCGTFGHEFVPADVITQNDSAIRAAKDAYDGLLPTE